MSNRAIHIGHQVRKKNERKKDTDSLTAISFLNALSIDPEFINGIIAGRLQKTQNDNECHDDQGKENVKYGKSQN